MYLLTYFLASLCRWFRHVKDVRNQTLFWATMYCVWLALRSRLWHLSTNQRRLWLRRPHDPHVAVMKLNLKPRHLLPTLLLLRRHHTRGRHMCMLRLWLENHLLLLDAVLMHHRWCGTTFTAQAVSKNPKLNPDLPGGPNYSWRPLACYDIIKIKLTSCHLLLYTCQNHLIL